VREEAKYPEEPSGPSAIDGTHTHTLLEECVKTVRSAKYYVGMSLMDHDGFFTVDEERAARVQVALDYIESKTSDPETQVYAETRVDPVYLTSRSDLSGTVDIRIVKHGQLEIIDYKDGVGVVDVVDNPQLEQYALGALSEYRMPGNLPHPIKTVIMTVIQPKNKLKGLPVISSHAVPAEKILKDVAKTIVLQAAATDRPDAPLIPGDVQCKWCKHKACPARTSKALTDSGIVFDPLMQTGPEVTDVLDIAQQAADKNPAAMTDTQLGRLLEAAPVVRQMLESAEAEVQKRLEAGTLVPGFKLVNGRGSRSWGLPEDEIAQKLAGMGLPKSAIYETKLISPAKVEKVTWEKKGAKTSLSPRQLKTLEQEYVTKVVGKPTVVPESDSRPAVVVNAAPLFSAVPAAEEAVPLPSWLM
jgi:hypothetical protein